MQHFELLGENDLRSAQAALRSEIEPEVESLLARVSAHLDKLERREKSLIAKCELQEGRLNQSSGDGASSRGTSSTTKSRRKSVGRKSMAAGGGDGALGPLQELKAKQMRQKKERLSYAVERLTLQAQQKERQLKSSRAAQ